LDSTHLQTKKNKFPHRKGHAIRFHSGPAQQFLQLLVIQTIPAQGIKGCNGSRNGEFASKDLEDGGFAVKNAGVNMAQAS
jgi:hypothetical protein